MAGGVGGCTAGEGGGRWSRDPRTCLVLMLKAQQGPGFIFIGEFIYFGGLGPSWPLTGGGTGDGGRGVGRGYLNDKQIVPPHAVWQVGTPQPYLHIFFFSPLTSLIS